MKNQKTPRLRSTARIYSSLTIKLPWTKYMTVSRPARKWSQVITSSHYSARKAISDWPAKRTKRSRRKDTSTHEHNQVREKLRTSRRVTGVQSKTNSITGSFNSTTNILSTSICAEPIKYSNPWRISSKADKLNSAVAIIKKWKKNITHFTKY